MSGTSLSCKTETLYPSKNSPFPLLLLPLPPTAKSLVTGLLFLCLPSRAVKTLEGEGWVGEWEWWSPVFWWYVTSYPSWCKNNLWFFIYLISSCPVYQTEASRSSAFLHWRRRQWKSRRWLPGYSNRSPTPPPLPSPLWAEGSLWSWTGTDRRFS